MNDFVRRFVTTAAIDDFGKFLSSSVRVARTSITYGCKTGLTFRQLSKLRMVSPNNPAEFRNLERNWISQLNIPSITDKIENARGRNSTQKHSITDA